MDVLKAQTRTLEMERQTNEARMHEPQNRAVLDRSQFLNTLFASKSFSWTAVMMDLEGVLPAGVQVTSIEPSITPERNINIRLRVNGLRELGVDLVRNLERSQRFLSPRLTTEAAQMQEQGRLTPVAQTGVPGGVEFDILSGYNPLPLEMKKAPAESGKAAPAGAKAGAQRAGAQRPAGAAAPARKKTAVPGVASKPATAKKPVKAGVPGVVH
jgi:type IV pilus assembly protein PilN